MLFQIVIISSLELQLQMSQSPELIALYYTKCTLLRTKHCRIPIILQLTVVHQICERLWKGLKVY